MTKANTTLLGHQVTREYLNGLAPVPGTDTFQPIQHFDLVEGIEQAARRLGLEVREEEYALRRNNMMLFGVMKMSYLAATDYETAIGIRQSLDKTMSIQMCAGASVFVCDNLCFRGDVIVLRQRHTWNFDLGQELSLALGKWKQQAAELVEGIGRLKTLTLTDVEAKALMLDAFRAGVMPTRYLTAVAKEYLEPSHVEFEPRTAWSLHNAFTEVQKQLPLTSRLVASQDLGKFMQLSVKLGSR